EMFHGRLLSGRTPLRSGSLSRGGDPSRAPTRQRAISSPDATRTAAAPKRGNPRSLLNADPERSPCETRAALLERAERAGSLPNPPVESGQRFPREEFERSHRCGVRQAGPLNAHDEEGEAEPVSVLGDLRGGSLRAPDHEAVALKLVPFLAQGVSL